MTVWHTAKRVMNSCATSLSLNTAVPSDIAIAFASNGFLDTLPDIVDKPADDPVPSSTRLRSSNVRQLSLTPSPSLSSSAFRLSSTSSAYATPPMLAHLNSISFLVSVPVLSENINSIWPSSSTREEVRQRAGVSVRA